MNHFDTSLCLAGLLAFKCDGVVSCLYDYQEEDCDKKYNKIVNSVSPR